MPADMNDYFRNKKSEEKKLNKITLPELERKDFKLCENSEKALESKAWRLWIYSALNNELPHLEAVKFYKLIRDILNWEVYPNVINKKILSFLSDNRDSLEEQWDEFIEKNIIIPETVNDYDLNSSDIIDKLEKKIVLTNLYSLIDINDKVKVLYDDLKESKSDISEVINYSTNGTIEQYIIKDDSYVYDICTVLNDISKFKIDTIVWPLISCINDNGDKTIFSKNSINYIPFSSTTDVKIIWQQNINDSNLYYYCYSNIIVLRDDKWMERFVHHYDSFEFIPNVWFIIKKWLKSFACDFKWNKITEDIIWSMEFIVWEGFYKNWMFWKKKLDDIS